MALSYSAYAIPTLASTFLVLAGESVTLHCDSRPSCTASRSVCEMQLTLGTSILSFAFFIFFTLSHKMTWTRCSSISKRVQHLLDCLLCMLCCMTPHCKWNKCNAEMVGHTGDSKTPGDEENPDPLPQR